MEIILTGNSEPDWLSDPWRKQGCLVDFILLDDLVAHLKASRTTGLTADAIVCAVFIASNSEEEPIPSRSTEFEAAVRMVKEVRRLEGYTAMKDGRKWNSIPIIVMMSGPVDNFVSMVHLDAMVVNIEHPASNLSLVQKAVADYRKRLLDELDNLGLLVLREHGRFRVGPALTPRDRSNEGHLYYGRADEREGVRGKYYTIDRDEFGIQYELEQFEALINSPKVRELDLQKFFEENPHFLAASRLMQARPLPHVRLEDKAGRILIPDFVMKPVIATQRDSNWEVLDLKLPHDKLLGGPRLHRDFSQKVMKAISQVKDYRDYFENPANTGNVEAQLGHRLRFPRLAVLIGRMPVSAEVELLERAQSRQSDVRVVTYDEILEVQRKLKVR